MYPFLMHCPYICLGAMYISGKLPTHPSQKLKFFLKREVSVDVTFVEGWVGSFPETYVDPMFV